MTQPTQSDSLGKPGLYWNGSTVAFGFWILQESGNLYFSGTPAVGGKWSLAIPQSTNGLVFLFPLYAPKPDKDVEQILEDFLHDYRHGYDNSREQGLNLEYCTQDTIIAFLDDLAAHYAAKEQEAVLRAKIEEFENMSMEVVEPCEPDCDEVRHALHEGSWQAHLKIENRIADLTNQLNQMKGEK